jgi:hypothetical protein
VNDACKTSFKGVLIIVSPAKVAKGGFADRAGHVTAAALLRYWSGAGGTGRRDESLCNGGIKVVLEGRHRGKKGGKWGLPGEVAARAGGIGEAEPSINPSDQTAVGTLAVSREQENTL